MSLEDLRKEIDEIDNIIIENLSKRKLLSIKIGEIKKELGFGIYDSEREKQLKLFYKNLSHKFDLDPKFVMDIFNLIIKNSRNVQSTK